MTEKDFKKIKKIVEEFFQKTNFNIEVEISKLQDQTIPIGLKTDEPKFLIGQNGQTLAEIQRLLKAILRRRISEQFYIDVDINDYKKKKNQYLREMAVSLADETVLSKEEKRLAPMPAYERRIIHLALSEREDVTTQSVGEEPERKVVINLSSINK